MRLRMGGVIAALLAFALGACGSGGAASEGGWEGGGADGGGVPPSAESEGDVGDSTPAPSSTDPPDTSAEPAGDDPIANAPATPTDKDRDGIDDALESTLAAKFAPVMKLPPDSIDWTRPANVDWYFARVHLRFTHPHCPDHEILALGKVTEAAIFAQEHQPSTTFCGHSGTALKSSDKVLAYFLQPPNDDTHEGAPPSEWKTYVHVKKSIVAAGGYELQYWMFYAYNDAFATFNHEADWERVTVTADASQNFHSAFYTGHGSGTRYTASQLSFERGTHVVAYVADGTHASYPTIGTFDTPATDPTQGIVTDKTYPGGPSWDTDRALVNVGERAAPLNGQSWIKYGGRWGEIGETEHTSGPPTPSFQSGWNKY